MKIPNLITPTRLDIVTTIPEGMEFAEAGKQTLRMHLDREPRFYAWVAFQNGYFECLTEKEKDAYAASFNAKRAGGEEVAYRIPEEYMKTADSMMTVRITIRRPGI